MASSAPDPDWRVRLHTVIFEADTPAGKRFDVALLWAILLSVGAVLVESVASVRAAYGEELRALEREYEVDQLELVRLVDTDER